jgi:hypothetical protein
VVTRLRAAVMASGDGVCAGEAQVEPSSRLAMIRRYLDMVLLPMTDHVMILEIWAFSNKDNQPQPHRGERGALSGRGLSLPVAINREAAAYWIPPSRV